MILLVHSNCDVAGKNIAKRILQQYRFTQKIQTYQGNPVYTAEINGRQVTYITLAEESVNAQSLPNDFPAAELVVFVSRHSSKSGTPTLSVHTPGNFGPAELGGLPRSVSVSPANAMSDALKALSRLKQELRLNYEVSYECTHHGPSLSIPAMFVELGSSQEQWRDQLAGQAVGQAAVEAISNFGKSTRSAVIGIGGTHYNRKFTQMALEGKAVFGHMIPKYALSIIDSKLLQQCKERTFETVDSALLDWKGIRSEDKPALIAELKKAELFAQKV